MKHQMNIKQSESTGIKSAILIPLIFLSCFILVIVWDMRKVHIMSSIIHNDHSNAWIKIEDKDLRLWLTPLDICMLKVDRSNIDLKTFRNQNCTKLTSIGSSSQRLFCNVGTSLGKQCGPPLSTRSFFKYHLENSTIGNPSYGYLNRVLKRYAINNKAIVYIGDGISKQNHDAMICQIMRTEKISVLISDTHLDNIDNINNNTIIDDQIIISNYSLVWPTGKGLKLDILFIKVNHLVDPKDDRKLRRNRKLRHLNMFTNSNSNLFKNSFFNNNNNNNNNNNKIIESKNIHHEERDHHNMNQTNNTIIINTNLFLDDLQHTVNNISYNYNGLLIIANVGAWYNSREMFRKEVPEFLMWLNLLGKNSSRNKVYFRETAAQHWNYTDIGYFDDNERKSNNGSCAPLADSTPEYDWRNRDVENFIRNNRLRYIKMIPFRDITAPLYNMHPSASNMQDCTHFCYFPQMWQSIWYYLYQEVFQVNNTSINNINSNDDNNYNNQNGND